MNTKSKILIVHIYSVICDLNCFLYGDERESLLKTYRITSSIAEGTDAFPSDPTEETTQ